MAFINARREHIANIPADPALAGDFIHVEIAATCDACGDDRPHRYLAHSPINEPERGYFHWDGQNFIVKCPSGHREAFPYVDVYVAAAAYPNAIRPQA
jgi:hypothetical protein